MIIKNCFYVPFACFPKRSLDGCSRCRTSTSKHRFKFLRKKYVVIMRNRYKQDDDNLLSLMDLCQCDNVQTNIPITNIPDNDNFVYLTR